MSIYEFWEMLDTLINTSPIVIDRKKNTAHPKYPDMVYPLDYGYLKDTSSMDGEGIDIFLGSLQEKKVTAALCTVDILKRDSEIKILISCTEQEKQIALEFCNSNECMKAVLINNRE